MVSILINGTASPLSSTGLSKVSDLIELIRAHIDPDHMIVDILLDEKPLREEQWNSTPQSLGSGTLSLKTDTARNYVKARLSEAPEVAQVLFVQFRDARKTFTLGDHRGGNERLARAVRTLNDFLHWYSTVLQLATESEKNAFAITSFMTDITKIAQTLSNHQMYQSWWAIAETIQKNLEPKLEQMEDFLRKTAWEAAQAA
jgi:hypothetical protein